MLAVELFFVLVEIQLFWPIDTKRPYHEGKVFLYRDEKIRTFDHLNPIQVLYQTELHPVKMWGQI